MLLDSRQKIEALRQFLSELKQTDGIGPFLDLDEISRFGVYDFYYINKNPPTFSTIEKNLHEQKYPEFELFEEDLRRIFIAVSDYVFTNDPLHQRSVQFLNEILKFKGRFESKYINHHHVEPAKAKAVQKVAKPKKDKMEDHEKDKYKDKEKQKEKEKEKEKHKEKEKEKIMKMEPELVIRKRPTLSEKLEMLFLLRAQENNEPYIRQIGEIYGIGQDTPDEYIIELNNESGNWMSFLNKGTK